MKSTVGNYRTENIVTRGLVLYLDAGNPNSYYGPSNSLVWKDISGNANNGTLVNGPTFNDGEFVFDGVNDYVKVAGPSEGPLHIVNTGDFTVNVWAARDGGFSWQWFLSNWAITGLHIGKSSTNNAFCGFIGDSTELRTDYSIPSDGTWHFYTVTRVQGNIKFFVNNIERTVISGNPANRTGSVSSTTNTRIGTRGNDITQRWLGKVGIEQIYNRALSASEISQNFNAQRSRFGI